MAKEILVKGKKFAYLKPLTIEVLFWLHLFRKISI